MLFFSRSKKSKEEDEELELEESKPSPKKFRDLAPQNRKKRTEPPKPWGRTERIIVLVFLLITIILPGILGASARNWKLPGLPKITLPKLPENQETIVIEGDDNAKSRADSAIDYFEVATNNLSGVYAMYVVRLDKPSNFGVNQNEVMQAASLIKLPVMVLTYSQSESGDINLDAKVPDSNSTYRELLEAMGNRSDNAAQVKIVSALGAGRVQEYIEEIGMRDTSLSDNLTTPRDVGLILQKLWDLELISQANRDELLGFLTDTIYEDWIAAGIKNVRVAHKYGREVHVVNDAAIVFSQPPFVLVLMGDGVVEAEADKFIPEAAKKIFEIESSN